MTVVNEIVTKLSIHTDHGSANHAHSVLEGLVHKAEKFGATLGGIFLFHHIEHFVHGLIEAGAQLHDTATKIGVNTKALQEMDYSAQQAGVSVDAMHSGLKFLAKTSYDAANGGKETSAVYKKLGIDVKDAHGEVRPAPELLSEVADKLGGITNASERTALAMKIFGRGGAEMLPLLMEGSEGLAELKKKAEELGGGWSDEFVKEAKHTEDAIVDLEFAGRSFKSKIGLAIFPVIDALIGKMISWTAAISKVLTGSKFLEIGLAGLAAVATAAAIETITAWLPVIGPFLLVTAAVLTTIAVIDDIHSLLTGGKSLIGDYLDEWMGVGTADGLVRQWAVGVDGLKKSILDLVNYAGKAGGVLVSFFQGDFAGVETKIADMAVTAAQGVHGAITGAAEALGRTSQDKATMARTDTVGRILQDDLAFETQRTKGRGINAEQKLDPSIPRAVGRGIGAGLAAGSAGFGQAAPGAVHPFLRPDAQHAAHAFAGHGGAVSEPGGHGNGHTVNQHNETNIHVEAKTDADPKMIAKHAEDAAHRVNARNHAKAREALGTPFVGDDGFSDE